MPFEPTALADTSAPTPRLTMLLWGEAGCGKTTLASTAPGKKLWLLLDPDGDISIRDVPDIIKIDLTREDEKIVNEFKKADPFGLSKIMEDYDVDTVVLDSLTRASELALRYIVPLTYKATMENPTPAGYGARNLIIVNLMHYLLRVTARANKNMIFITHEGAPQTTESGQTLSVSMMLGGQLPNLVSKDISEVWNMQDEGKGKRRVGIRPERKRAPMKSRIFDLNGDKTGFDWQYNTVTKKGLTLSQLWQQWKDGSYAKLSIP